MQAFLLDPVPPSDNHIHFILYGLLQTIDATTIKKQITQQNCFLAQTGIIPILNITQNTMNSGFKERLLVIPSFIDIEPIYLTTKSGKRLVIVKKVRRYQARTDIDKIINDTIFPDSQIEQPGRSNRYNINSVLDSYAVALQNEGTPTAVKFHNPPQHTVKRHIHASYDVDNINTFSDIGNKKGKMSQRKRSDIHSTSINTTASISNEESTIVSNFSRDNFFKI